MKEGLGNIPIITIIIVFITLVSGYLAYNVNYTKAFKMKNKIISLYEEYNGNCGNNKECLAKIQAYAKEIGYTSISLNESDCNDARFYPQGYPSGAVSAVAKTSYGYCEYKIRKKQSSNVDIVHDLDNKCQYRILTKIDIKIPIIQNVMNLRVLNITGDTSLLGC